MRTTTARSAQSEDGRTGYAACGEVELFYEDLDDLDGPPVVLIMGVGAQLPMWPDGFCARLVKQGYWVIAQVLAGSHADRTKSLAIIMSGTGKPFSSIPRWRLVRLPFQAPAKDAPADERLAFEVRNIALFNGPSFLPPTDEIRRRVTALAERSHYPQGMLRQFDAILGTGSLLRYARHISAPTVVIHGTEDPMVRPRNGRNVARAIPQARFLVVDGMGHDLPRPVWAPIVDALVEDFGRGA